MKTPPLEDILDSLQTAVLRLDAASRAEYLNPAAADLLETSPRHARGRALSAILPVDELLPAYIERATTQAAPVSIPEMPLFCGAPPGHRRLVSCEVMPLEGGAGVQLEFQVLDQRPPHGDDASLHQNVAVQRLLFQALAHEIKNPLSGMRGAAQLLATENVGETEREYLDVMLREIDRLRDLVDALLGPARPPRPEPVNIHAVLEHVRSVIAANLPATLDWQRDYDPSLPELNADPDQLTQVFLNLVGNAVEVLGDSQGAQLLLRTRIERNAMLNGQRCRLSLRVDVQDNGPGVPESLRDTLFLPLITGRAEGTGLGLPIAQDIVQRHGGTIEWRSEPGQTVFSVILPLLDNRQDSRNE